MEHRWYSRKRFVHDALLYSSGQLLCRCQIENISLDGLYVSTPDVAIEKNNPLDVIVYATSLKTEPLRTKTIVIHEKREGVGLLCIDDNPVYQLLNHPDYVPPTATLRWFNHK